MKDAAAKRKREDDHEDAVRSQALKKSAKSGRRSLRPVRPYSVDDFANYLGDDGRMNWDTVEDSFHFDIRFLDPKEKKPPKIAHGTEPFLFKSEADDSLDVEYVVQPAEVWKSMNKYRRFTISNSSFAIGDYVLVSYDREEDDQTHAAEGEWPHGSTWPAKILRIIAGNESHVYLLVNYFFRPEDIEPGMMKDSKKAGRQPHHARHEIIASNWLEVVDAKTVSSKVDIEHWNEQDDNEFPDPGTLFWRQHLNYVTKQLSPLKEHCVCHKPSNPDKRLIQCDNKPCLQWLHEQCLIDAAIDRLCKHEGIKRDSKKSKGGRDVVPFKVKMESQIDPITSNKVLVYICEGPRDGTETTLTENVLCLFCKSPLSLDETEETNGEKAEDKMDAEN